jgi:hypothetical protein
MGVFTSTSTGCADITYNLQNTVVSDTDFTSLSLDSPLTNSGNIEIHPTDIGKKATYTFELYTEVSGGFNQVYGPYILQILCGPSSVMDIVPQ